MLRDLASALEVIIAGFVLLSKGQSKNILALDLPKDCKMPKHAMIHRVLSVTYVRRASADNDLSRSVQFPAIGPSRKFQVKQLTFILNRPLYARSISSMVL